MKRVIAAALTCALFAGAVLFCAQLGSTGAATAVCFVSVNDTLLDLTDDTMPVGIDGEMYVPYTVFLNKSLDMYCSYNRSDQIFTLYNGSDILIFDMNRGYSYNGYGGWYSYYAAIRNSKVYLPAKAVCKYFGLAYSYTEGLASGNLLRVKNDRVVLSDSMFIKAAVTLMELRLNDYLKDKETGNPSVSASASPSVPPTVHPTTPVPPTEDTRDVAVYLAFDGINADYTPQILDMLTRYHYGAVFFVTADEIKNNDALIRRIAGTGQSLGFLCTEGESLRGELKPAAQYLDEAARVRTLLVTGKDAAMAETAAGLGYLWWSYTIDGNEAGVVTKLEDAGDSACIGFSCTGEVLDKLDIIFDHLSHYKYDVRAVTEAEKQAG